jgi:hypothetical protein
MDGTGSGSCLVAEFDISGDELSDSATKCNSYYMLITAHQTLAIRNVRETPRRTNHTLLFSGV